METRSGCDLYATRRAPPDLWTATALKLFSPAFVGIMTSEQLEEAAGEDARQERRRKQL